MKSTLKTLGAALMCAAVAVIPAHSQSFGDIINTAKGVVQDLSSSSNFDIKDVAGTYKYSAPAVALKGDNALKNIGGSAAATQVEQKLAPIYEKAGLDKLEMTIEPDSTFSMKVKSITLTGTLSKTNDGLTLTFDKLKSKPLNCIATKSGSKLSLCFDATKAMEVVEAISKQVNISSLKTASSLLSSFDDLYVGFEFTKTGDVSTKDGGTSNDSKTPSIGSFLNGGKKK